MFVTHSTEGYSDPLPGIRRRTLAFGDRTLMTEFLLAKDSVLPRHDHPYEQTGYLVRGHIVVQMGNEEYDARAGDAWCIPSGVAHGTRSLEDSVVVEVFSPLREDYLPAEAVKKPVLR